MALLITDNTVPEFWLSDGVFKSQVFTAPGADTFAKGTLLARLTATGKLVPYEAAQSDGSEIPLALLAEELIVGSGGDTTLRVFLSGTVREDQLLVYTGGSPVAPDSVELSLLHDYGIIGLDDRELLRFDNS